MRSGFQLPKPSDSAARFGHGIYSTATSSKSADYPIESSPAQRVIFVVNVVAGEACLREESFTEEDKGRTSVPEGYDSIVGNVEGTAAAENEMEIDGFVDVRIDRSNQPVNGPLNYDELVVFNEDAILPTYLVVYDTSSLAR